MAHRIMGWFVGGTLVVASVLKVVHVHQFIAVLSAVSMDTIPVRMHGWARIIMLLVVIAIFWEMLLGLLLLAGFWRRKLIWVCTAITFLFFSAFLIVVLQMENTPGCGCFGGWPATVEHARLDAKLGLVRNLGFIGISIFILVGLFTAQRSGHVTHEH